MKKINLRDYYPYYTQDMIVEVPDEVALLLREYMLLEEAYRIRTYRYKAFYSLDRDEGIEREILQKPLNPAEIWEQRQMTELIYKGLSKLPGMSANPTITGNLLIHTFHCRLKSHSWKRFWDYDTFLV